MKCHCAEESPLVPSLNQVSPVTPFKPLEPGRLRRQRLATEVHFTMAPVILPPGHQAPVYFPLLRVL